MKKRIVIKTSSLPVRLPVTFTTSGWLLLDRLAAPGWAFGVFWTLVAALVVGFIYGLRHTEFKDVPGFGEK
ncbi:hypothetical protein LE190_16105 [Massilia oculi]|uniref:DUF3329 domain-containing protein n=1 Tax=Massilia hydrophila TaxID=3044279 RepID=A0ABS7YEL7_9BURK|nr:hypothetical protein [Massilia oculi]MCA1857437.1 hypothetical protein [Massilia oculi]